MSQQRIDELKRLMYGLECSDDLLFSNANGNYNQYQAWQNELNDLTKDASQ